MRGYSIESGEPNFNQIIDPPNGLLKYIDSNLYGYFVVSNPYPALIRVKLQNGGIIDLEDLISN